MAQPGAVSAAAAGVLGEALAKPRADLLASFAALAAQVAEGADAFRASLAFDLDRAKADLSRALVLRLASVPEDARPSAIASMSETLRQTLDERMRPLQSEILRLSQEIRDRNEEMRRALATTKRSNRYKPPACRHRRAPRQPRSRRATTSSVPRGSPPARPRSRGSDDDPHDVAPRAGVLS